MRCFSGDGTDDPIAWMDDFVNIMQIVNPKPIAKIFQQQLNQDSPAQTWWNNKYTSDRNCWDEIKAVFIES
jgi:hypothetical protein